VTDYPDWTVPQASASAIAATGVPLLTGKALVFNPGIQVIAAGGQYVPGTKTFTQPGFEIFTGAFSNAASATPYVSLELAWTDSSSGVIIMRDTYIIAGGSVVSSWLTLINGPTAADTVFITATNLDGAHSVNLVLIVLQNSRVYDHDVMIWDNTGNAGNSIPGVTLANLPNDNSSLGNVSGAALPANSTVSFLCGPGYGDWITLSLALGTVAFASVIVTVFCVPTSFYGATAYALRQIPAGMSDSWQFRGSRCPLLVSVTNTSGVAGTVSFNMIGSP
jgi:hypothetical protein